MANIHSIIWPKIPIELPLATQSTEHEARCIKEHYYVFLPFLVAAIAFVVYVLAFTLAQSRSVRKCGKWGHQREVLENNQVCCISVTFLTHRLRCCPSSEPRQQHCPVRRRHLWRLLHRVSRRGVDSDIRDAPPVPLLRSRADGVSGSHRRLRGAADAPHRVLPEAEPEHQQAVRQVFNFFCLTISFNRYVQQNNF